MSESAASRSASFKLWSWRIARILLLSYLGAALVISMLQEWIIFPGHASQGKKHAIVIPNPDEELVPLTTSIGDKIYVLFGKSIGEHPESRPTIIFFYGNAMNLSDATGFCREWRKLGANVIGVEYPGYGMSSGAPGEKPFYAAVDSVYDYAISRPDIDKSKIISVSLSIGCGAAVDLASRKSVAGLVLFAPFTSLDDMARHSMPWFPTSLLLRHHFYNEQKIADLDMPILIAHGLHDTIIPTEMSHRLARAATKAQVKTLFVDSDHNDLFEEAGKELGEALKNFIDQIAAEK